MRPISPMSGRLVAAAAMVLAVLSFFSCAGLRDSGYAEASYSDEVAESAMSAPEPSPAGAAPVARAGLAPTVDLSLDLKIPLDGAPPPESEPAQTQRLRVYSADLELVVASVETARNEIILIVEAAGGYIESSTSDYLVVRVPVSRFEPVLGSIESSGDVRSRTVRTADVTDQFFDLQRRIQITEASRNRLLELLEETQDADERVAILRDIRRLTEELEQLRSALESLDQLIQFSRITISLISRIQISTIGRQEIPFSWIRSLAPLSITTYSAESAIPIVPGDSFAVFQEGAFIFAEAADGTQVRAGAVPNEPRGTDDFWQSALRFHLAPFYRNVRDLESGEYAGVLLESRDLVPFSYLVLVHGRDDELVVVEVFFPGPGAVEARLDGLLTAVAGGQP